MYITQKIAFDPGFLNYPRLEQMIALITLLICKEIRK